MCKSICRAFKKYSAITARNIALVLRCDYNVVSLAKKSSPLQAIPRTLYGFFNYWLHCRPMVSATLTHFHNFLWLPTIGCTLHICYMQHCSTAWCCGLTSMRKETVSSLQISTVHIHCSLHVCVYAETHCCWYSGVYVWVQYLMFLYMWEK